LILSRAVKLQTIDDGANDHTFLHELSGAGLCSFAQIGQPSARPTRRPAEKIEQLAALRPITEHRADTTNFAVRDHVFRRDLKTSSPS
jgi:hypothetical protein